MERALTAHLIESNAMRLFIFLIPELTVILS